MPAPNFTQIQAFGSTVSRLKQAAVDEFASDLSQGMTEADVAELAQRIAAKYSMLGEELGAQWYDLCTQMAGIDAEPADLGAVDYDALGQRTSAAAAQAAQGMQTAVLNTFLQDLIDESIRVTGNANLHRDYERGLCPGRWARVPVGDTCAWCLMLASQGAWYVSEETALGIDPGHYHSCCNCEAVYHADPEGISGYQGRLEGYKRAYYDAENARLANASGRRPYSKELAARIAKAKAEHKARYDAGLTDKKWTVYNETLVVMREQQGIS